MRHTTMDDAEEHLRKSKERDESQRADVERLQARLTLLRIDNAAKDKALADRNTRIAELQKQLELAKAVSGCLSAGKDEVEALQKERDQLLYDFEVVKADCSTWRARYTEKADRCGLMYKDNVKLQKTIDSMRETIEGYFRREKAMRNKINRASDILIEETE